MIEPKSILRIVGTVSGETSLPGFTLKNDNTHSCFAEVVLDYHECEGGIPSFQIEHASGNQQLELRVVYSETIEGIALETGN